MKRGYCLSCYAPEAYVFSVPLWATAAWLKRVLRRKDLIDGTPLRKTQFDVLRSRVRQPVEVGWYSELEYFLEGYQMGRPNKTVQRTGASRFAHSPNPTSSAAGFRR
jgi:hypothetical protein